MSLPLRFQGKTGANSSDSCRLPKNAGAAIDDTRQKGDGLAISDITLLELATLSSKGRIRLNINLESFLHEIEARFIVLPMSGCACVRALGLPAAYPKGALRNNSTLTG